MENLGLTDRRATVKRFDKLSPNGRLDCIGPDLQHGVIPACQARVSALLTLSLAVALRTHRRTTPQLRSRLVLFSPGSAEASGCGSLRLGFSTLPNTDGVPSILFSRM